MKNRLLLPALGAVVALASPAQAAVSLTNLGFEDPAAGKITGFDATTDVPGWQDVGTPTDSGVEDTGANSGDYRSFFKGRTATDDRGASQMTGHTIALGDVITVGFWAMNIWAADAMTVVLFADSPDVGANEVGWAAAGQGGLSSNATWNTATGALSGTWQYYEVSMTAGSGFVAQELGVHFVNTSASASWTALDDVTLSVTAVPEPSAALLGGLGLLGLLHRRRR